MLQHKRTQGGNMLKQRKAKEVEEKKKFLI